MKRLFFTLFITLFSFQAFALRTFTTWQELQDSSDFIVWAKVIKIEEIGENKYRTTLSVLRAYKGNPPAVLSFEWNGDTPTTLPPMQRFEPNEISDYYLLFAKKNEEGYQMFPERFMKKRDTRKWGRMKTARRYPEVSLFYIKDLPDELEKKVAHPSIGNSSHRMLYWDDVKAWLDQTYPE